MRKIRFHSMNFGDGICMCSCFVSVVICWNNFLLNLFVILLLHKICWTISMWLCYK